MVVKINNVLILYWQKVFSFAYCFINPDIELGIWLCSHRERLLNPIEGDIYEKFKKINGEKFGENDIKSSKKINRLLLSKKYKVILK